MARKQPKQIPQMTVAQFEATFPNEDACDAYLVARRWPNGVICPRCGSTRPYPLKTMKFKWECPDCSDSGYRFSNIAGTIFANTNVDLRQWFRVIHLMLTSKKGMSARQIHRYMGFGSYKTAWYMCHRIRAALIEKLPDKLGGVVEIDETWIGGKDHNRHWKDRHHGKGGGAGTGKTPIIGAIERKGNVVARVLDHVSKHNVEKFVRETVSNKVSLLATDEHQVYSGLKDYPRQSVHHKIEEYVIGAVHTNTIEGFWSIFKRGIVGTFHKMSVKYMPLYVAEFQFRYNNRNNPDVFGAAIAGC
ncbi:MAG TPA: IS1595 family transposase [Xanthobacteraceae bacterium]|nr:IS1595 family transposase [Xanthobacteraceae bacterium]